jgi:molybdopterin-guanine dinucleotide biosynthesis protein B
MFPVMGRMLVVTLIGLKKCGKTTTAEALISEFKRRGLSVGGVKFMPNSTMNLDIEGKDTWRHRKAGADFVISLSRGEIGFIGDIEGRASLDDAMRLVPEGTDILVCEGLNTDDPSVVKILLARDPGSIEETMAVRGIADGFTAISGIISSSGYSHPVLPVIDATDEKGVGELADLILAGKK